RLRRGSACFPGKARADLAGALNGSVIRHDRCPASPTKSISKEEKEIPMPPSVAPESLNHKSLAPGVWGVVATPFQGSTLDVDLDSLSELVEHYETIGATGLTVLGVFGEAAALTAEERRQVLE